MKAEAQIDLQTYMAQAPDPEKDVLRYRWHLERYQLASKLSFEGALVADVGCGLGLGTRFLADRGFRVCGIELNPAVIAYNQQRFKHPNAKFVLTDIAEGDLEGGPYDLICLFEVIEHLENPDDCLRRLKASMAPGALLILSTPNNKDDTPYTHPHHFFEYNLSTFNTLITAHFQHIKRYSQGRRVMRRQYEAKSHSDKSLNKLRNLDRLQVRRFLPTSVRQLITNKRVGMSWQEIQNERVLITESWQQDAGWLLAACSN